MVFQCAISSGTMLLSMRRTGEPDAKRLKFDGAVLESEGSGSGEVLDETIQRLSVCSVDSSRPTKKRAYVRQFGVTEKRLSEAEYVDITQIQQLLLDSAASGKSASDKNRRADSQDQIERQERDQEERKATPVTPQRISAPARPHSQPSASGELYRQGRQLEYFSKVESPKTVAGEGKGRMLPEGFPSSPLLQTPPFSAGGHSPNVEELFALWFGVPSGNGGE